MVAADAAVRRVPVGKDHFAVVDAADYDLVSGYSWYLLRENRRNTDRRYAVAVIDGRTVSMHRLIGRTPPGMQTDHKDGDGLNNRGANLRPATRSQNAANSASRKGSTSRFKGVSLHRSTGKWMAQIRDGNPCRGRYLGLFVDEEAAARAYDTAAAEQWGEFAWLNFPGEVSA